MNLLIITSKLINMLTVMDSEEDLLHRAVMNFLEKIMRMNSIEVRIKLGSRKGPGKCSFAERGRKLYITFKLVEEGTSVEELATSCIEYLGNPWRSYIPALSFAFFLIAAGLQMLGSTYLTQLLTLVFISIGVMLMVLAGTYMYKRDKRIKSLVKIYKKSSEVSGRIKELYAFFIDAVSYLLEVCEGKDKAVLSTERYVKSLWKAHRKTFRIMGLEKPKL